MQHDADVAVDFFIINGWLRSFSYFSMLQILIFLHYMLYSLMLHMLILDVAKPFICCMQHVTHVAMGILLLHNRPMLVLDVECPGASKSLKSYEGLAAARGGPTWVFS